MSEPREYFPSTATVITAGATSSEFQLVNDTSGPKKYAITCTAPGAYIRRGFSDVSAATSSDTRLVANMFVYYWLNPGEGVRAIRNGGSDAIVYIGDLSV